MRYLRQQNINRRAPFDQRLYVDMTSSVIMNTTNHMMLPKGTTSEQPASSTWTEGMMRYNITTHEVEVYQGISGGATWRSLRFKEPTKITQQDLGNGDAANVLFGPLTPTRPAVVDSRFLSDWQSDSNNVQMAKQYLVFVENVFQISGTNFEILYNPAQCTGIILAFDQATKTITSSNTGVGGINFSDLKFQEGDTITVSGSLSNNGSYTIDTVTSNQITVLETLVNETQGHTVTVAKSPIPSGYYIAFDSPVPLGKAVTVYHGFDQ